VGIIATDPSGLSDSTTYYFKVNGVEYDITTGTSPTFEDVAGLLHTALNGAGFGAKVINASGGEGGSDIRVYNNSVRGSGSQCRLENGDTSPDLFANLNFWPTGFRKPIVYAIEPAFLSFVIEREMSGEISLDGTVPVDEVNYVNDEAGGSIELSGEAVTFKVENVWTATGGMTLNGAADTVDPYEPTEGTAFFGDAYYQDEYYGDEE
jgi:hypothetical protein